MFDTNEVIEYAIVKWYFHKQ